MWINPISSTRSMVYGRVNSLENVCAGAVGKLDRNPGRGQGRGFCTFHPVDIHRVLHRRLLGGGPGLVERACNADMLVEQSAYLDGMDSLLRSATAGKFFFFACSSGLQPDLYTTLVVVVNARLFLWTSQFNDEKSGIYVSDKSVHG